MYEVYKRMLNNIIAFRRRGGYVDDQTFINYCSLLLLCNEDDVMTRYQKLEVHVNLKQIDEAKAELEYLQKNKLKYANVLNLERLERIIHAVSCEKNSGT